MRLRRLLFACLLVVVCVPVARTQQQPLTIHFIDVGAGDAILIQTPSGHNVLYDGGPHPTRVLEYLISRGVKDVTLVVASHNSDGHIGGLPAVLRYFRPRFLVHNGVPAATSSYAHVLAAAAEAGSQVLEPTFPRVVLGDVSLVVLPPPGIGSWEQNDNSIGIIVEHGEFRASLVGDAESRQWAWWRTHYPDLLSKVHVHKVGGHGSTDANGVDDVRRLRPELAVISVAEGNAEGLPDGHALGIYAEQASKVLRTDVDGTIVVEAFASGSHGVRLEHGGQIQVAAPQEGQWLIGTRACDEPGPAPSPVPVPSGPGVLRVHPTNPLFLTDNSGRAIYLAGHQIFVDLQDNTFDKPFTYGGHASLDWPWYVSFLKDRRLNYVRNWTELTTGSVKGPVAHPMPYRRVEGHGQANDGGPKFDLDQFDQAFFDRLRARALDLQNNGIYLSITFFDWYAFTVDPVFEWTGWRGNLFNSANNINGVHADLDGNGQGTEFFTAPTGRIRALQQAYVRKVIDTVNDLDNIFFETGNEVRSVGWHYELIEFAKNYEAGKPKQHLILLSPAIVSSQSQIIGSSAPVFAVDGVNWGIDYLRNPPPNAHGKPGIIDLDHVAPFTNPGPIAPWTAFTRGYHFNLYDSPFEAPEEETAAWELTRTNIGAVVEYSRRFSDLAGMRPSTTVSSTQFALAKDGAEYLILQPRTGTFTVTLPAGTYEVEVFNPATASVAATGSFSVGGGPHSFSPPFEGSAVLYLRRTP